MKNEFGNEHFESYTDRIIEKGLLQKYLKSADFDITVRVKQYEAGWKLCIDLDCGRQRISDTDREFIGDAVMDYFRHRGAFEDIGLDPEAVDWICVSINGCPPCS